jgi:hypothetical protein
METRAVPPLTVGILSDTHLTRLTPEFSARVEACFAHCAIILHAGDLTEPAILAAFGQREVHAVHGNMCSFAGQQLLPWKKVIRIGPWTIGLIHRVGDSYAFEEQLLREFDGVDCIVYGHTHRPLCEQQGGVLLLNPGSFLATGRHGHPGTYATLSLGEGMVARIHEVPSLP